MFRGRRSWILDFLLLFLFTAILIRPLWKLNYIDNWASIESTFIADARMLKDHWPRPLWQPFWYVGTRFDYIYPPALRYGTAAIAKFGNMDAARAYHIYVAFFYCFGIAGVYLFARLGFANRWAAIATALAAAIIAPAYLVLPEAAKDMFRTGPTRLNVLVRYGEGPHMTSFAWIPFVLAFTWLALQKKDYRWSVAAGFAAAVVVANNFYGATALAIFFPLLLWALWVTSKQSFALRYALPIPLIAFCLSAFWLTPSYLQITLRNMQFVSAKPNLWSNWVGLITLIAFLSYSNRRFQNRSDLAWPLFIAGSTLFFTLNTVGNYWLDFRVLGEPMRLAPELDLIWIWVLVLGLLALWRKGLFGRGAVVTTVVLLVALHFNYIRHHRAIFPLGTDYKSTVYWRTPDWIAQNYPQSRAYVTGAVRFWYNTWHDLYQLGGSSEQGLQNTMVMPSQWEIVMGPDPKLAVAWLQVMGVDLVAVHGPKSDEWYKDFLYPKKFDGVLKQLHEFERDNHIYEVPRRYRSMARIVDRDALNALPKIKDQTDLEGLERYVAVYENGPEAPTRTHWRGTDELDFEGSTLSNQTVILQTSYDSNWRAESNLGRLPVTQDQLGFVRIDTPVGVSSIRLIFDKPLEKTVGEILFVLTILASGWILWKQRARA